MIDDNTLIIVIAISAAAGFLLGFIVGAQVRK